VTDIATAKAANTAAIANCKVAGYEKAQKAAKAKMDADAAEKIAADKVKLAYTTKAAFGKDGGDNALCGFPAKAEGQA
jgi:hypothetical protein